MIKTEHLQVLDYIVKNGSFKAAADALHISQPSVSVAIKNLELSLGFSLFDRSHYRPILTEKGEVFYQKAKHSLENVKSLSRFAKQLVEEKFLELHIAVDAVLPYENVIDRVYDLVLQKSHAYLYFNTETLSGGYDKVIKGEVDMALSPWLSEFPLTSEIEKIKVYTVEMVPVVHKRAWESRSLNDLVKIPQIIARDTGAKTSSLSYGVLDGSHKIIVNEPSLKERFIKKGYGWGRVSNYISSNDEDLIEIPDDLAGRFGIDIHLIRLRERPMSKDVKAVWDALSQFAVL